MPSEHSVLGFRFAKTITSCPSISSRHTQISQMIGELLTRVGQHYSDRNASGQVYAGQNFGKNTVIHSVKMCNLMYVLLGKEHWRTVAGTAGSGNGIHQTTIWCSSNVKFAETRCAQDWVSKSSFFVTVLSGFVSGCCLKSCFYVWVGMIARPEKLNSNWTMLQPP